MAVMIGDKPFQSLGLSNEVIKKDPSKTNFTFFVLNTSFPVSKEPIRFRAQFSC